MSDMIPLLSQRQFLQLQEQLLKLKFELSQQTFLAGNDSQPVKLDQQLVGRLSRIDAIQQQQMAVANREQVKIHLRAVMIALQTMESGDYGYCCVCGGDIGFKRLEARPEATLCLSCQRDSE